VTLAALLHRLIRHAVKELREVPERRKNEGRERWRAGPKNRVRRPSWDNASGGDPRTSCAAGATPNAGGVVSLFDERALRALVEQATEKAVRMVLRENPTTASSGPWVTTASLAKDYSIAQSTIRQWIRDGKLRARHVGRALRVNLADFERLVSISSVAVVSTPSPEELADLDEIRDRRSKKA
jgi:excisionase family DNA binding protein